MEQGMKGSTAEARAWRRWRRWPLFHARCMQGEQAEAMHPTRGSEETTCNGMSRLECNACPLTSASSPTGAGPCMARGASSLHEG